VAVVFVLLFVDCAFFFISLQEKVDTVTVEGVENVGEEDWVEIKTGGLHTVSGGSEA
jgi:hypothetical protein